MSQTSPSNLATAPLLPVDTTDEDAAALGKTVTPAAVGFGVRMTEGAVPPTLAAAGYKPLVTSPLWAIQGDWQYIYRPLAAWDAAQVLADDIIRVTDGRVFSFVSNCLSVLRQAVNLQPEEGDTVPLGVIQYQFCSDEWRRQWVNLLGACPELKPNAWARDVIVRCDVRRIPSPAEEMKPDSDPTKDHGGPIFQVKGAGEVGTFYRGNRDQIVRIGLAAAWGSVGDFFVSR